MKSKVKESQRKEAGKQRNGKAVRGEEPRIIRQKTLDKSGYFCFFKEKFVGI